MTNQKPDVDQYLLQYNYFGQFTGRRIIGFCDREETDMNRADTIKDMIEGQVEDIVAVYRANDATGLWSDVSEDFALDIIKEAERQRRFKDDGELDVACRAFLELTVPDALAEIEGQNVQPDHAEHSTLSRAQQGV